MTQVLPLLTLVDYTVTPRRDHTAVHREGCLSVPGLSAFVERAVNVHVTGYDGAGERVDFDA
jgi:peptide deformylase